MICWFNDQWSKSKNRQSMTAYSLLRLKDATKQQFCKILWRKLHLLGSLSHQGIGTLSTDDGDGNGDVGTEWKDWGENAVAALLNIKHLPNLQR